MAALWLIGMLRSSLASALLLADAVTSLSREPLAAVGEPLASSSAWLKVWLGAEEQWAPTAHVVAGDALFCLLFLIPKAGAGRAALSGVGAREVLGDLGAPPPSR